MEGLMVVVLGLGIVFLVLGCLVGILMLIEKLQNRKFQPSIAGTEAAAALPAPQAGQDDPRIAAVIAAAVAVMTAGESERTGLKFVVRRIKRK